MEKMPLTGRAMRKAWKLVDGKWEDIEFEDLRPGDTFRLEYTAAECLEGVVGTIPEPCNPPGNWGFQSRSFSWCAREKV